MACSSFRNGSTSDGVVAGVAAGEEDMIQAWAFFVKLFMHFQFGLALGFVGQFKCRGRPNPVIHVVFPAYFAHFDAHFPGRNLEMRAWLIVFMERNTFHCIAAENCQIADVLVELCDGPGIVSIGGGSVPELVPADRVGGRRGYIYRPGEFYKCLIQFQNASANTPVPNSTPRASAPITQTVLFAPIVSVTIR